MTYRLTSMLEFEDEAQALDAYEQLKARATNTTVVGIGTGKEHTSYAEVRDEDNEVMDGFYLDKFGIVRKMPYVAQPGDYPLWVQPEGGHDAYPSTDMGGNPTRVEHDGQYWENTHGEGNTWEPGAHGWEVVE